MTAILLLLLLQSTAGYFDQGEEGMSTGGAEFKRERKKDEKISSPSPTSPSATRGERKGEDHG